ncbi:hypothetical protein ABG067_004244 [Albugo candida]
MTLEISTSSLVCCSFMGLHQVQTDQIAALMKIAAKPEEYEIAGIQTHCGSSRTRNQSVVQTFVYIRCNETISAFFCEKFGYDRSILYTFLYSCKTLVLQLGIY